VIKTVSKQVSLRIKKEEAYYEECDKIDHSAVVHCGYGRGKDKYFEPWYPARIPKSGIPIHSSTLVPPVREQLQEIRSNYSYVPANNMEVGGRWA